MGNEIETMSKEEWMASKGLVKKKRKKSKGVFYYFKIVFILFILFLMFLGWREKNIEAAQQKQKFELQAKKDKIQTNAITYSKIAIQKMLKSPSTASFPNSAFQAEDYKKVLVQDGTDNQIWYIQSYVDSQNSFGATARSYWSVKIQVYDDETYKILDVDIK